LLRREQERALALFQNRMRSVAVLHFPPLFLSQNCCSWALRTKLFSGIVFRAERSAKLLRGRLFIFSSWPSMCFGSHTLPSNTHTHNYKTQHSDTLNSPCGGTWSRVIFLFFRPYFTFFVWPSEKWRCLTLWTSIYGCVCECVVSECLLLF